MKKLNRMALLASVISFCCLTSIAWSQDTAPGTASAHIVAAGSGVNLEITRLLAKAFIKYHPRISIDVPGSIGTRGAITASADGAIALGLISRTLSAEEEREKGLVAVPYARVAIVVAAHPAVSDEGVTFTELINIYKGTKTRWQDGHEIIVQAREKSDSGFQVLQKAIPGFKEVYEESYEAKRWAVYFTDQEANRALSSVPYAIGVTDLGMISTEHLKVKVLKLDGILPTSDSIRSGHYPLKRDLSFIYRKGNISDEAQSFVDFVLSENGARILRANGFVPLIRGKP